jgi:hypothetical protein
MSKQAKFKVGDEVWVKGTYDTGDNGSHWVNIKCLCAMLDDSVYEMKVNGSQLVKPPIVRATPKARPKVAKKQQPTKGAKKK